MTFAEALWAFDHPSSDDEGPAVAAVAPVSNRDENGYLDDAAAYKLCCGPFSDEEEQGPVSEQADSLSDSLAEFYSDPLISAAVAASAAVPDKPAESAAESAVPAKPTPTTNTPAAESATTADTTAVAAASKSQTKNKNKRRSGRSRRRSKSQRRQAKAAAALATEEEDVEWPVPVNPELKPYFSPGAAKRVVNGKYQMTDVEREAFLNRDRTRQSKVVGIDQSNHASNLRIFNDSYTKMNLPYTVLADSGADLGICITRGVASQLGLTWTPGSAPLAGVNGTSSEESIANEYVNVRLGGNGDIMDITTTPEGGCFHARIRPNIMSPAMRASLGFDCILGQELLWRSLASFDQLKEEMHISPAYASSGCAEFRIAIPCFMSTPRTKPHALASLFQSTQREQGYMSDYAATNIQVGSVQASKPADPAPAAKPSAPHKTSKGWGGVVASPATRAWRCVMRAISKPSPKLAPPSDLDQWPLPSDTKTTKESKPKSAAPLHPGFPQESSFPTKQQWQAKRQQSAARNAAHKAEQQELLENASFLVAPIPESQQQYKDALLNSVKPTHLTYSVDDLKRTGRLKADGELELGDNTSTVVYNALSAEAARRRAMQADFDQRIKKLEAALQALTRAPVPARSAPLDSLTQTVKDIIPPVNTTPAKPLTPINPTPGASSSGKPQEPVKTRQQTATNPIPAQTAAADKGKAKAEPAPQKQPVIPPKDLVHSNQPLVIGSSPAEAHLKARSGSESEAGRRASNPDGWTEVKSKPKRNKRELPPAAPSTHPMGTRRGTAAQSAPQGGQPVAAAQPSRRGDHIPADTTAWDLLMGRRYTRTAKPAAPSQPTKQPANPQSSGGSKRVAWKLPAAATANAAVAVASALAILPTARAEFAGPVLDPSILLQDEGAVWAQIFAALLIWVVFRLGRYLAGASRRAMRFLNMTIFLVSIAWVQQMLGLRAPVAALWQSAIAAGWAAPVFWSAVAAGALFVLAWFKTERALFRKALRL
jgi:uncharacterized protein YciI